MWLLRVAQYATKTLAIFWFPPNDTGTHLEKEEFVLKFDVWQFSVKLTDDMFFSFLIHLICTFNSIFTWGCYSWHFDSNKSDFCQKKKKKMKIHITSFLSAIVWKFKNYKQRITFTSMPLEVDLNNENM